MRIAGPPFWQRFWGQDRPVAAAAPNFAGVNVQKGDERGALPKQMFAQPPPHHARSPNEDRIAPDQRPPSQVMGFGAQKVLKGVAPVGAGQAVGMLPPVQQDFCDFPKPCAGQIKAQPQVIVFCPSLVLVTTGP